MIDGGEATQLSLPNLLATGATLLYNQIYFTTPKVEVGPHTLTVAFFGDDNTTPRCLDYLYIKTGHYRWYFHLETSKASKGYIRSQKIPKVFQPLR